MEEDEEKEVSASISFTNPILMFFFGCEEQLKPNQDLALLRTNIINKVTTCTNLDILRRARIMFENPDQFIMSNLPRSADSNYYALLRSLASHNDLSDVEKCNLLAVCQPDTPPLPSPSSSTKPSP